MEKIKSMRMFDRPFKTNLNREELDDFIENVEVWAQSKKVKVNDDIIENPTFEKIDAAVIAAFDDEDDYGVKPFIAVQTAEEMQRVAERVRLFKEEFESKTKDMNLIERALWAKENYKRIADGGELVVKVREI